MSESDVIYKISRKCVYALISSYVTPLQFKYNGNCPRKVWYSYENPYV